MLPWCKMNDEELDAVVGGVTPNLIIRESPVIPVPGEPLPGEDAQIFIFF